MDETTPLRLPLPMLGLYEAGAHADQPVGTTPSSQNVRGRHPTTRRKQLCQRGGLTQYNTTAMSGANPVREIVGVVKYDDRVTYTTRTSITNGSGNGIRWQTAFPSNLGGIAIVADNQGNTYTCAATGGGSTGINYIVKTNPAGAIVWKFAVPLAQNTHYLRSIRLDIYGDIYVCLGGSGTDGRIYKYRQLDGDAGLVQVWDIHAPNGGMFADLCTSGGVVYAIENTASLSLLHRIDGGYTAEPTLTWGQAGSTVARIADTEVAVACAVAQDGACIVAVCDTMDPPAKNGFLRKYGPMKPVPAGGTFDVVVWSYTGNGVGQAVVVRDAAVYSCGYGSGGTPKYFVKLADSGATVALTWDVGTAEVAGLVPTLYKGTTSMDVDALGVLYATIGDTGSAKVLARIKADGSGADFLVDAGTTTSLAVELYGVACDPNLTDAGTKSERVYVTGTPLATTFYAIHGIDLLTIATADGSPRSMVLMAACNGNIVKFASGGGASTTPTGGSGALSTTARWTMAAEAGFNRVLWTDGTTYRTYDAMTDIVTEWKAVGTGTIPPRGRLLAVHNGAVYVAGFEDQAQNWAKSENNNLDGWDFFPVTASATQAVIGNQSDSGECPDIITALMPVRDDLMWFGGDHSIWQLTGDPAAGGRFDLVTKKVGVAFGRAWCVDDRGVLYFFGSRGGVYRMVIGSQPEPISDGIDARLKAIDVGANAIRLEWNDFEQGVHVFVTPYAGGASTHFFWCRENGRWDLDVLPDAQNPTAVYVSDGDAAGDRVMLLGGSDGKVRYWNRAATSDDGTAITSWSFIGPIQMGGGERMGTLQNVRCVLPVGSGSMDLYTYGSDEPDFSTIGTAVVTRSGATAMAAGRNAPIWDRTMGQSIWVKVGRFVATVSAGVWALETIDAEALDAGIVRPVT